MYIIMCMDAFQLSIVTKHIFLKSVIIILVQPVPVLILYCVGLGTCIICN